MALPRFDGKYALLLYDQAAAGGDEASRDVFDQLDAMEEALRGCGMTTKRFGVSLDLGALKKCIMDRPPDVAINLVESVDGSDRLQTLVPLVLEDWRVPFTGCGSAAMLLSNDKIACKRALAAQGLPVLEGLWLDAGGSVVSCSSDSFSARGDWIVKAVEAHASLFLDDSSVLLDAAPEVVAERVAGESVRRGMRFFAERYIDGREFNISLLEKAGGGVTVLPAAEIRFDGLPEARLKIVGYAAKWAEASEEYCGTVRSFDFSSGDAGLVDALCALSRSVWDVLALSGYARVDFRVDAEGRPYILEVNVNPCITPDAGFAAAAERGGFSYAALAAAIVGVAGGRGGVSFR